MVTFDQMYPSVLQFGQKNRRNDAGKATTTPEVDPAYRLRMDLKDLATISDVPVP
jgi:hypothetical protein